MRYVIGRVVAALALALTAASASAQGQLNIVCSVQLPWCEAIVNAFAKETGIRAGMTQKAAGEAMAQIAAEKANPKIDVWYTGSGDPHLQAAELGLTEEYKSPNLSQLHDWAVRQAEQSKFRTVGVYTGALGIGYNPEILAKKNLPPPKCWADLANPIYKDEVQMANPNASGTAYATLATLRAGLRRGEGVRPDERHAQEHQQLSAQRTRRDSRRGARRNGDRRHVSCMTG